MTLNLWDCGGQDIFMENFLTNDESKGSSTSSNIFRKCEVLIHVFDVEGKEVQKDIETFKRVLANLRKYSPNVKIFILIHKMDLIQVNKRQELFDLMFNKLRSIALDEYGFNIKGFATSIWDESLYKAWSSIVCSLIPNISLYEQYLSKLNGILNAREIILFEKTTFLVISSTNEAVVNSKDLDPKRFEKISNIIKTYKQSVNKIRTNFSNLILHGKNSSIYLEVLTSNIYIMIILDEDAGNEVAIDYELDDENLVLEDIKIARELFERIETKGRLPSEVT
ncbi:DEKNAAC103932 [Brettanomyces naardenensis]|uniref:GTP-binding protein n=1 Tax=Brettanomyces naardenensis TaxID=13370 RepID=A0A448YPH5_BRENA|nr:DEKNAAC103932 [Brettanomyces naardenensis]